MKKYNSEPNLRVLSNTVIPDSYRQFRINTQTPDYADSRTAEILANNEIESILDETEETHPLQVMKDENKFLKNISRTKPIRTFDEALGAIKDFESSAKKVKRGGGRKTKKRIKKTTRKRTRKKRKTKKRRTNR